MKDALGDRIKRYELASQPQLLPRCPVIVRVDGKAFHTWTKPFAKPFDNSIVDAMVGAAFETGHQMQGFKLGYVQSDEATFLLTDYEQLSTQPWFGYELNKVVSVSASMFTAQFNRSFQSLNLPLAYFDSRAFNVPEDDVANVFVWRQKDWRRNSIQMLARSRFSHRDLLGKNTAEMHAMLDGTSVFWSDLPDQLKYGTFVLPDGSRITEELDYSAIVALAKL